MMPHLNMLFYMGNSQRTAGRRPRGGAKLPIGEEDDPGADRGEWARKPIPPIPP
jgi:hypothetical protein